MAVRNIEHNHTMSCNSSPVNINTWLLPSLHSVNKRMRVLLKAKWPPAGKKIRVDITQYGVSFAAIWKFGVNSSSPVEWPQSTFRPGLHFLFNLRLVLLSSFRRDGTTRFSIEQKNLVSPNYVIGEGEMEKLQLKRKFDAISWTVCKF